MKQFDLNDEFVVREPSFKIKKEIGRETMNDGFVYVKSKDW